jgi:hypothetical protein
MRRRDSYVGSWHIRDKVNDAEEVSSAEVSRRKNALMPNRR